MKFLIALLLLIIAGLPLHADACSCVPPGTPAEEKAQSSLVFVGRVQSVEERTPRMDKGWVTALSDWFKGVFGNESASDEISDFPYKRVRFAVSETFKGTPVRQQTVRTGMGGGDCGYFFETGQEYVVYAWENGGTPSAGICSLTGPASDPRSGLRELRADK
ncbi:hypothetical protein [Pseudoxanthomonas sp. PXM02]|uniref:hypothetical protein n=1 Tax=Pseudoxanthomonas sp. PXM02 TaxID=2769294 RepID=UPI0017873AEF|nr:hypothetical protein [Pseudoxanthomonas sp. PXM02]MBD9478841.1 hypothetical protein [Pseudoxanthomonas sp. PXM02]